MNRSINPRLLQSEPLQRCILAQCGGACCLHGVWLAQSEVEEILQNAAVIAPHMPPDLTDPQLWFTGETEPDPHLPGGTARRSRVLPDPSHYGRTACVFLRSDHKCALQVASYANGLHPWHWKPFYCILHPLDLDEEGRITLDAASELAVEPGSCLRPAPQPIPLLTTFEPELRYLLGDARFDELARSGANLG